jgi:hypothetical protein
MVLKLGSSVGQRASLPWESIDPADRLGATDKDKEEGVKWFTNAPPGEWEMDGSAPTAEAADDSAAAGPTPIDSLSEVEEEEAAGPARKSDGGGWTVAVLCMGLGLIAACLIIPQADANRRLVYQREQLKLDLTQVQKQIGLNKEFLLKMEIDPQLTERLAQREMRAVKQGESVVAVNSGNDSGKGRSSAEQMSPFGIVNVPPPAALEPYRPAGGMFAELCRDPRSHMYILGGGMMLVAVGLTLGGSGDGVVKVAEADDADDDESLDEFIEPK